jgi:hypothetical protein
MMLPLLLRLCLCKELVMKEVELGENEEKEVDEEVN